VSFAASNRLRRVDNFILLYEPSLITRSDGPFARALFVDLDCGFNLPLKEGEHICLIRAFNVLCQNEEEDFVPAYERLAERGYSIAAFWKLEPSGNKSLEGNVF